MPIVVPDIITERGKQDAKRHRERQRKAIKKRLPSIIAEESIITSKKGKIVKIPIKIEDIPHFKHGRGKKEKAVSAGQGRGKPGDIISRRPGKGAVPGAPGTEPGIDYIEAEVEIEELVELMFEDLGLPRLEEKEARKLIVELGYRIHGITRAGPHVLLNHRKTAQEGIRRFWNILKALQNETGRSEIVCSKALKQAGGIIPKALDLLKEGTFKVKDDEKVEPFPIIHPEDYRYHRLEEKVTQRSQAVIFPIIDVSGSMTEQKIYYARSMIFWLVRFLEKIYEHVEIRFIAHHATARIVKEEEAFKTAGSGGTRCYTAYELANSLIESDYPLSQYNVYIWHFSDGEDWDPSRSIEEVKKLFAKSINMFGYGEIRPPNESFSPELLNVFKEAFQLTAQEEVKNLTILVSNDEQYPFLGVVLRQKEHIYPALRAFLKRDRWSK